MASLAAEGQGGRTSTEKDAATTGAGCEFSTELSLEEMCVDRVFVHIIRVYSEVATSSPLLAGKCRPSLSQSEDGRSTTRQGT